jgi:Rrf2 family transcriptional regulator, cysteine metabolism repressor
MADDPEKPSNYLTFFVNTVESTVTELDLTEAIMNLSQKCQYAFRAVFELSRRHGLEQPVSVTEIAEIQAIPPRFLEQILAELRQGGFVISRRGAQGGYILAVPPSDLRVGDIVRFIEGPISPVKCIIPEEEAGCTLRADCLFQDFWQRAKEAVEKVYDSTTFQDLVREAEERSRSQCANYNI